MNEMNVTIEEIRAEGAVITAIGVGGGGSNMVTHLFETGPHKSIRLIAANTDVQHLEKSSANIKMKLGEKLTKGLGAGMRPEIGEKAALETYEEIKEVLSGSDIVFVSAGLGGGTGTGAAPVVAKAAKEVGALTVSIVTKPFSHEGLKRTKFAKEGLNNLRDESDCIIVIPNDRLLGIIGKTEGTKESFKRVNEVLARAVNGISGVILDSSDFMNVDFADVRTVMSHKGLALMGVGESEGDSAAVDAVHSALESPLLDHVSIRGAMGALVNFTTHENFPLNEVMEAMGIVNSNFDEDADVVQGHRYDNTLAENQVQVTIIATGFEREIIGGENAPVSVPAQADSEGVRHSAQHLQVVPLKVSNGEYSLFDDGTLEVPTYLRKQKD